MSMPALLSHFGINKARYVTTTGEIIFDGVTQVGSDYMHPTHGAVTPVTPHTFHRGEDVPGDPMAGDASFWSQDEGQIHRHVDAMAGAFPGFRYAPGSNELPPAWVGEINTGRGRFTVGIALRTDRGLPRVSVLGGVRLGVNAGRWWVPAPHLYTSGNLCVADQDDWDPDQHTAATVTAWAAHWLAAYTEWRITRRWPTEGVQSVAS